MDLEEYRRTYMSMEGATNTPINAIRRIFRLGKNVTKIPKAMKQDESVRKEKKDNRKKAMEDMKKNGVSSHGIREVAHNLPGSMKNTRSATKKALRSTAPVARSVNEMGQTSMSIVGSSRANPYDGQDLEKGISFAMTAYSEVSKGLRLPAKMAKSAASVGHFGVVLTKYTKDVTRVKHELSKSKQREQPEPER